MELQSCFSNDDPISVVDPADLRGVLAMQRDVQAKSPNQQMAISAHLYEQACSPGADIQAVWYRAAMLQLLAGPIGLLSRWLRDGDLDDAVIRVAATFPMKRVSVGAVHHGLPLDVQEFIKEIEKQDNQK